MSPPLLEQIHALIETPSVSSVLPSHDMSNRAVVDLLANWLADDGFDVRVLPVNADGSKANIVATRGRGEDGLVLAGHTDTVPYDEALWSSDPLRVHERDGRLYGLGTSDMKAFLALAIEAARRTRELDAKRPLIILGTADEEKGMDGARALVQVGIPGAKHAIIGEPTGMRPVRMHKGVSMESLVLEGRSGHSSDPSLGASALEGMRLALDAIVKYRTELQARHTNPRLRPPVPTINLGNIHGGDNPNRICGRCELQFDIRVLPGMDEAEVRREIHQRVSDAIAGLGLRLATTPLHEPVPPFETAATAAIVRAAEEATGSEARAVAFGTEGPYLTAAGLETLVMGPGDIDCAHQPDEHLDLDRIEPCLDVLTSMITRFCA